MLRSIKRVRRGMYRGASVLGDVIALFGGPTKWVARVMRKTIWRLLGRLIP